MIQGNWNTIRELSQKAVWSLRQYRDEVDETGHDLEGADVLRHGNGFRVEFADGSVVVYVPTIEEKGRPTP